MAIRDLNCSSAVTHIDLENTGIASTAMSITILQAPWMMSACVSQFSQGWNPETPGEW